MANIPTDEKVFMVDRRTNTTYGGSAALQAMQEWYTMQDVIDTVDANLPSSGITGSGTLNYVPKFTDTEEVGDSQIFDDGTNVGIGTDTPLTKLQVDGSFHANQLNGSGTGTSLSTTATEINLTNIDTTSGIDVSIRLSQASTGYFGTGINGDFSGVKTEITEGTTFVSGTTGSAFGIENSSVSLYSRGLIQTSEVPANQGTPAAWMKIYDFQTSSYYFIPVYN